MAFLEELALHQFPSVGVRVPRRSYVARCASVTTGCREVVDKDWVSLAHVAGQLEHEVSGSRPSAGQVDWVDADVFGVGLAGGAPVGEDRHGCL